MRKVISIIILTGLSVALSYLINNKNQCCDQVFQAGWPFSFYGGSGGIIGIREDQIIYGGLVKNIIFWFMISLIIVSTPTMYKNSLGKKAQKGYRG